LSPFRTIGVKVDAPAAAEDAVVTTGQAFEQIPRVWPQCHDSERVVLSIGHVHTVGTAFRRAPRSGGTKSLPSLV
jgi:hypothetical protein